VDAVPYDDLLDLEYKCVSPTVKLEFDSLAAFDFVKNEYHGDGVDVANFVLKNKVGFMPCKVAVFAEDCSVLTKGGEKCPVEHPPERCASALYEQYVPTSLTGEFEKCAAPVSAAFVVGVLERALTHPVKVGLSADFSRCACAALPLDVLGGRLTDYELSFPACSSSSGSTAVSSATWLAGLWWQKAQCIVCF
jgi:hypothetical protein